MLAEFWHRHVARGFHREDLPYIREDRVLRWTLGQARQQVNFDAERRHHPKLHANLLPQPFIGNLALARVFILFGNPGFALSDYEDEMGNAEYEAICAANLRNAAHGFYPLLPEAAVEETGAGRYWCKRLRSLQDTVRSRLDSVGRHNDSALDIIRINLAGIESGAYHSKVFPGEWVDRLPSSRTALRFVHEVLLPRAERREVLIFVWRRARYWRLPDLPNIIQRPAKIARLSHLLTEERNRIAEHLVSSIALPV